MISVVSQYVIGFTCHNESMLIGLFRQRHGERKWLSGTRDEPLRTSAWEARSRQQSSETRILPNLISWDCFSKRFDNSPKFYMQKQTFAKDIFNTTFLCSRLFPVKFLKCDDDVIFFSAAILVPPS